MDFRTACSLAVADTVRSWPIDLCRIVANLAIQPVRWSAVNSHTERTIDGFGSRIVGCFGQFEFEIPPTDRFGPSTSFIGPKHYVRIAAESTLSNSHTDWILQFDVDGFYARIGVLAADGSPLLTTPAVLLSSDVTLYHTEDTDGADTTLPAKSVGVRFSVSANLRTGTLSIGVWTMADPTTVIDWFSATISPVQLAGSVPVVYLRGQSASVRLVTDG